MKKDPVYPVGKFEVPSKINEEIIQSWIKDIEDLPDNLEKAVKGLNPEQLSKSYRKGGWNIAQIVHHFADSHLNAYLRMKLAVEQDGITINHYDENKWADLEDGKSFDLDSSLSIIKGLHKRWAQFLKSLDKDDFQKSYFHPEQNKKITLLEAVPSYAWHCKHHVGHIENAVENPQ